MMMGKYQSYLEYKNSGVDWIGDIPRHWKLTRIKFITECLDGARIPLNAQERGDMQGKIPYWGSNKVVDYVNDFIFDEELLLLGEDGAPFFDATKDVAFNVSGKIWPNNHVHVLRPEKRKVESRFLKYAINCADFHLYISGSTRDKLNQSDMNEIYIRSCQLHEQESIANFLDYETAKIDNLIEKQQHLIKLLKEKRQAVISHAVTKGLNPDAPMKDSGVEWLDKIPEHWDILRLSFALKLQSGDTITSDSIENTGKYLVYGGNGTRGYTTNFNCDGEYVLIGRQGALCGNINVASGRFFASEHAIVVYPRKPFNTVYLAEILTFMDLGQYSVSAAQPGVSVERLDLLKVILPPENEQVEMSRLIIKEDSVFQSLSEQCESMISLLIERRTALISAAVTGKIDVRN